MAHKMIKRKFRVLLDMSPIEEGEHTVVPLQDQNGNPMNFTSRATAAKAYKESGAGYFDHSGRYVEFKHKIVQLPDITKFRMKK